MSASRSFKVPFANPARALHEIEFMRLISNVAWNSSREDNAFDSFAAAIGRLPGFLGFRFEPLDSLRLGAYESVERRRVASARFTIAEVAANGEVWGEIRLFFDPSASSAVENPFRLAQFIGQQIGLLLNRLTIQRDRQELLIRQQQIGNLIRRRKLIHMAVALLAKQRNVSAEEAIRLIVGYSRQNRRRLSDISELLILACNRAMVTRPVSQRASSNQRSPGRPISIGIHQPRRSRSI